MKTFFSSVFTNKHRITTVCVAFEVTSEGEDLKYIGGLSWTMGKYYAVAIKNLGVCRSPMEAKDDLNR